MFFDSLLNNVLNNVLNSLFKQSSEQSCVTSLLLSSPSLRCLYNHSSFTVLVVSALALHLSCFSCGSLPLFSSSGLDSRCLSGLSSTFLPVFSTPVLISWLFGSIWFTLALFSLFFHPQYTERYNEESLLEFKRSEASKKRSTLRRVVIEGPVVRVHSRRGTAPDGQPAAETLVTFTDLEHFKVCCVSVWCVRDGNNKQKRDEAMPNTARERSKSHWDVVSIPDTVSTAMHHCSRMSFRAVRVQQGGANRGQPNHRGYQGTVWVLLMDSRG